MRPKMIEGSTRGEDLGPLTSDPVEEAMSQSLRYAAHGSPDASVPSTEQMLNLARRSQVRPEVQLSMDEIRKLAKSGVPVEDFMWGPSRGFARQPEIIPQEIARGETRLSPEEGMRLLMADISGDFQASLRPAWDRIASRRHDLFDSVAQIAPSTSYAARPADAMMMVDALNPIDPHAMLHEAQHLATLSEAAPRRNAQAIYKREFPAILEELQSRLLEKRFE